MFPKLKPNSEICLIADLVPRNAITVKDRGRIPNQSMILRAVARAKYRSTIDLWNWYFQVRVSPENEKYNTIKTPFGSFACRVMLQGDTNAPATAMRVIEHVLDGLIGKNVWHTLTISQSSQTHKRTISEMSEKCARDYSSIRSAPLLRSATSLQKSLLSLAM